MLIQSISPHGIITLDLRYKIEKYKHLIFLHNSDKSKSFLIKSNFSNRNQINLFQKLEIVNLRSMSIFIIL